MHKYHYNVQEKKSIALKRNVRHEELFNCSHIKTKAMKKIHGTKITSFHIWNPNISSWNLMNKEIISYIQFIVFFFSSLVV